VNDLSNDPGYPNSSPDTFIAQRTRITCEADLEDHVLVVVTLKAEGLWGNDNHTVTDAGAGTASSSYYSYGPYAYYGEGSSAINRRWDVGVTEAYVQLNQMFFTPATLKLGRQYLHYGRGLILSSIEQEYNFDAARLILDYYPLTIDVVGAALVESSSFGPGSGANDSYLAFVNARYETTSVLKSVEAYFGLISKENDFAGGTTSRVPPTAGFATPMLVGARVELAPVSGLEIWGEAAYEFGDNGPTGIYGSPGDQGSDLSAWIINLAFRYTMKQVKMQPSVNGGWIWASGDRSYDGNQNFLPWFDYMDGYNGYVLSPKLSNIHIFNLGASVKPAANCTVGVQGYYFLRDEGHGPFGTTPVNNGNIDNGGIGLGLSSGNSKEIGWEIDTIIGYDYSKDVRLQLVYGVFIPENVYHEDGARDAVAQEVRGEVSVKF
jgi:hypothetical protein